MSLNSNLSFRDKADVLDVFRLHSAKVGEALEALALLKQAMYAMGAGEPLRAVLSDENPLSQLMVSELVENALYVNLRDAEHHVKAARNCLDNFIRVFKNAHTVYTSKAVLHD